MSAVRPTVALALCCLLSPAARCQIAFDPGAAAGPQGFPYDVLLQDLDGDGWADLVRAEPDSDASVVVQLNLGAGIFGAAQTFDFGSWGEELAAGDLDGDGDLDLLTDNQWFVGNLRALLNDGAGGFTEGPSSSAGSSPEALVLADLDGDGILDVLLANWNLDSLSTAFGDGSGAFLGGQLTPVNGGAPFGVAAGDFDGDGDPDAALACFGNAPGNGRLHLFDNDGAGALSLVATQGAGSGCWAVQAGDLDGDGDLDLLTTNRNTDAVQVFGNDGRGGFTAQGQHPVGHWPIDGQLVDLDGDGDLDVAVPSVALPELHLLSNDGSGQLTTAQVLLAASDQITASAGDLDGDGDLDLISGGSSALLLFENHSGPWSDQGGALPGGGGAPVFSAAGALTGGHDVQLELAGAAPHAQAFLVAGASQLALPFKGGTLLPSPDVLVPRSVGADGSDSLGAAWPVGIPAGLALSLQWWIVDAGGPAGFAASNGQQALSD